MDMRILALIAMLVVGQIAASAAAMKALIVDGQNNHAWQQTTPVLKKLLEESGLFSVDVATSPKKGEEKRGEDMSAFQPEFAKYAVVISNYNGEPWGKAANEAFEKYVRNGGGFVSYHAADNAFPDWKEYNQMIAVGGWGDRKAEVAGVRLRYREGKVVTENAPGNCGHHGSRLPFQVIVRDPKNPIVKGLPGMWMHGADELYDSLCGPAREVDVVATAMSEPSNKGTGENEPMLMTVKYGKGRVFHTTLGHDVPAMQSVDFIATFLRGAEWAATGKVKQAVPVDFPKPDAVSLRK